MNRSEALKVANGNEAAADFVVAYVNHCHLLDDIVDKDKPVDDERIVREQLAFFEQLLFNPWAQPRQGVLWPLIVTGHNAWLDANDWETDESEQKQRDADVVKGVYHELVWFVSYLCGGLDHMRKITSEHRKYDHDYGKEKTL